MSNLKIEFFQKVLKGIWSPFFRNRIKKELLCHIEDLIINEDLTEEEALKKLGNAHEMNLLYKDLFYKKIKNDFYLFGSISTIMFGVIVYSISGQVDNYINWSQGEYQIIKQGYIHEMDKLHDFVRGSEEKNAASYIKDVLDRVDQEISFEVFSKLEEFDYWDNLSLLPDNFKQVHYKMPEDHVREMVKLVQASYRNMEESKDEKAAQRQHRHLAKLIYTTETMAGFRIAQNMMKDSVYLENGRLNFYGGSEANRVSGMTWSLMNLQPSLVKLELDFKDKNYYQIGICHHAQEIWFQDIIYQNFLKSSWPLEKQRNDELLALEKIKKKLESDCRLSFINYSTSPTTMSALDINTLSKGFFDGRLGSGFAEYIPEGLIPILGHIPYLRALAGRYVIWRTSISDYEAKNYYKDFEG
jgi:hypothetical protein